MFLEELETFFDTTVFDEMILARDLSLKLEKSLDRDTITFQNLIETFRLTHHVIAPTHVEGGTFDVLLTTEYEMVTPKIPWNTHIYQDLFPITFDLNFGTKYQK